jgi:hypothetical protein
MAENKERKIKKSVIEKTTEVQPNLICNDLEELPKRLKEFETKVILEQMKITEKSISLIYKEMLSDRAAMKEIKQILSYILLTQEEIMNVLNGHIEQQSEEDIEKKMASDAEEYAEEEMKDGNKKWN